MINDIRRRVLNELFLGRVLSGIRNCHLAGLHSLVLHERISPARGMLRLFYTTSECQMDTLFAGGDFSLLPHNHRQDITLYGLCGRANNQRARLGAGYAVRGYAFGSALLEGNFTVTPLGFDKMGFAREALLKDGPGLFLPAAEVHTVTAEAGSAWVVEEGLATFNQPICYSLSPDLKLSADGLYKPMVREEIMRICEDILERSDV